MSATTRATSRANLYASAEGNRSHDYLFPALDAFLSVMPSGGRVLDLGCGNGALIARFQGRGFEIHGVDFSPSGIMKAREAYPGVSFHTGDVSGLLPQGLIEGTFDAVVSTEVIEHLLLPLGLLRNASRVLKPRGRLFVSTPYHGYLKNLCMGIAGRWDFHFHPLTEFGHVKFWSQRTLTTALIETGFDNVLFKGVGRVPLLWKSMVLSAQKKENVSAISA
jgi:2-polyprenyl-3-methyl-5-hydroxy-6-metoxy-1,4-benzoquinol methylase